MAQENEFEKENLPASDGKDDLETDSGVEAGTEKEKEIETETEEKAEETDGPSSEALTDSEAPTPSDGSRFRFLRELFDWIETFALSFAFIILVFTFLFKIVTVSGHSMNETLQDGDRLIISDAFYTPKCGDIVVIVDERTEWQDGRARPIIKRVIATEGQRVDIDFETWTVSVDGKTLDEPYVLRRDETMTESRCPSSFLVGKNQVFVMGDNRNNSSDSRFYGTFETDPVSGTVIYTGFEENDIVGRVMLRLTPISKLGTVD